MSEVELHDGLDGDWTGERGVSIQTFREEVDIHVDECVLDALRARRSMPRVKAQVPPRKLIERIITAAVWAPNHHRTEPWRFIVIEGQERESLGEVMAESLRARLADPDTEEARYRLQKERVKPMRAPVLVAVAAVPSNIPRVVEVEEICAVAAGVQNMLLAAEALGLGAMWRTGEPARDPAVKRFLGFPDSAHIIAFVYLGYPDLPPQPRPDRAAAPYITWRE